MNFNFTHRLFEWAQRYKDMKKYNQVIITAIIVVCENMKNLSELPSP